MKTPELSEADRKNLLDASDHLLDRDVVAQAQRIVTAAVTADREAIATRIDALVADLGHDESCSTNNSWRTGGTLTECDCFTAEFTTLAADLRGQTTNDTTEQETR